MGVSPPAGAGASGASGGGAGASGGGASGVSGGAGASGSAAVTPVTPAGPSGPFAELRPVLLLFALVDKLQSALKDPRKYHTPAPPHEDGADAWLALFKARLRAHDQGLLKELVSVLGEFEEELLVAADGTEIFDVLGLLGDVLAEAPSVDAWLGLA